MFFAEFLDDLGPRRGFVADRGAPDRRFELAITAGGKPCGKSGNGLARWIPAISQWPVVVSFPGDASVHRP
jgi:hypothetical protein